MPRGLTRVTADGRSTGAVWSPDGARLALAKSIDGSYQLFSVAWDGSGEPERLLSGDTAERFPPAPFQRGPETDRGAGPSRLDIMGPVQAVDFVRWLALGAVASGLGCEPHRIDLLDGTASSPLRLHGESRRALVSPLPLEHEARVRLPRNPFLELSTAVETPEDVARGRVRFTVDVSLRSKRTRVFDEILRVRRGNRWRDRRVNLAAWRGEEVEILFEARPEVEAAADGWARRVRAAWGEPAVVERADAVEGRTSVVLLLVDTLRRDFLGAYGFEGDISPNMDWLARESVLFEQAFTQAPWTKPSVATLFTSVHPDVHGVDNHGGLFGERASEALTAGTLVPEAVTLAECFGEAGYRTAAFVANPWLDPRFGFDQGFDRYELDRSDESLMEGVLAWLDARDGEPFFLYLHLMGVHGPYDAPEADFERMRPSPSLEAEGAPPEGPLPPYLEDIPWFSPEEWRREEGPRTWGDLVAFRRERSLTLRARYAANVRRLDRDLRPFLDRIRNSELNEEVVLLLTSDHGEELLEHGGWDHGFSLYDHEVRVPMMVRLRAARGGGRRVSAAFELLDVAPTLLALAGLDAPPAAQGRDLSAVLEGERASSRFASFATATKHREGVYSVRTDRYKLLYDRETETAALFDLEADPGEYDDISAEEPELTQRLLDGLADYLERNERAASLSPETAPLGEELRKTLESLGYLGGAPGAHSPR